METVSVIIPCAPSHQKYLAEAVRSAERQDYPQVEVLVVGDGFTPLLRSEAPQTAVLGYNTPGGVARALNLGVAACDGQSLVFLGADDVLDPRYVSTLQGHLKPGVGTVASDLELFGDITGVAKPEIPVLASFGDENPWPGCALISREAFGDLGGLDERFEVGSDYDLWIRMCKAGWRFEVVHQPLYRYRRHQDTLGARPRDRMRQLLAQKHPDLFAVGVS